MNNQNRFKPTKRTALDGLKWWVVFDTSQNEYPTLTVFGKYAMKRDCQYAIDEFNQKEPRK